MKKILFIIIAIIFMLGMAKESYAEEYDPYCDGRNLSISGIYTFSYENNSSSKLVFKGYVIHQTISMDIYKHFICYGGYNGDLYLILTRSGRVESFYQKDEMDLRVLRVPERKSYSFDGYDKDLDEYPYSYISVATYEEFEVDEYSSYSKTVACDGSILLMRELFYFGKPSVQKVSTEYHYNPQTDGQIIMGLICIYDYEIEYVGSDNDYLDYGENQLKYIITTSNGDILERYLTIYNIYDSKPVFTSKRVKIPVDVNNPKDVKDIINQNISAYDEIDGDVTGRIQYMTVYNPSKPVVGEYELLLEVTDLEGLTAYFSVVIVVFDSNGIVKNYNITASYSYELSEDEIMRLAGMEIGATYRVVDENYSEYSQGVGTYYFNVEITNIYGMTYPIELSIDVVDDISPVVNTSSITTTTSTLIGDEDIIASLAISDYSKYIINIDKSDYIPDVVGSYKVYVDVIDSYDNKTSAELYINVTVDNKINYYNKTIRAYTDYALSQDEVIAFLRDISNNSYDDSCESSIESDYFNNPLVAGSYSATLITKLSSGLEIREDYVIEVKEVSKEKRHKKKNIFKRILLAFKRIFLSIARFFRKLFEFIFK